jgi:hypothetical protein
VYSQNSPTFPSNFIGTWRKVSSSFPTITITLNTYKKSNQSGHWNLISISGNIYTLGHSSSNDVRCTETIRYVNDRLEITGCIFTGDQNCNGTWIKLSETSQNQSGTTQVRPAFRPSSGPNGYSTVVQDITYNGRNYTFYGWQEKRFYIRKQYLVFGDSWLHSQSRSWLYGESTWSSWEQLANPVPLPVNYNSFSLQQEIENLPNYQLSDDGSLLLRNTNSNNRKEFRWEGDYIYIMTYAYRRM